MKLRTALFTALIPLGLSACSYDRPADKPAVSPAAKVIGEAESCIPIASISSTRIRDDYTIDFMVGASKVWRNTLPNRCPGLRSENAFTYETSLSQLCSTDIIYVLRNYGGSLERGPGCGLGKFVPVELEK